MTDSTAHERVRRAFFRCCELTGDERKACLRELHESDPALAEEVESLLRFDHATDLLSDEAIPSADDLLARGVVADCPDRIGQYRILGVLGEGGSGVVYEAEQESPRRRVALKVLRRGLVTESVRRRFVREAEVVGRLQHPGIAQVYEAVTERGTGYAPHIAMELVRGHPLSRDAAGATIPERIALFCRVCDAVQYAHEMSVVHRDLKPANILVDDQQRVKVLDFGVARLLGPDLVTVTSHTHAGQIIGTVPYMSPEQVAGDADAISTATDVYALGVVLFELLTGELPHDVRTRSLPEAARIIGQEEPTRLGSVDRTLRGDLEVIVGRALAAHPGDRYQSVGEFASDLRAFLASEPIKARPPSTIYQLRKFTRRNRLLVGSVVAILAVLAVATALSASFAVGQYRARAEAELAGEAAQEQVRVAERINRFLVNDLLGAADPMRAKGEEVTVREVLDRAAVTLDEGTLDDQPAVASAVHLTVGQVYRALGLYEEAEHHLRRSLELAISHDSKRSQRIGNILVSLGGLLGELARMEEADEAYATAIELFRQNAGPDRIPESTALTNRAMILKHLGQHEDAEKLYLEGLALREAAGPDAIGLVANSHHNLGSLYRGLSRNTEAIEHLRRALEIRREALPDDHPERAMTGAMLASALNAEGEVDEARALLAEAQPVFERAYGHEHQYVATTLSMRAELASRVGDLEEALTLFEAASKIYASSLGEDHPYYALMLANTGDVLDQMGKLEASKESIAQALNIFEAALPAGHPHIGSTLGSLGYVELQSGDTAEAIEHLERSLPILLETNPTAPRAVECRLALAIALREAGREDEATALVAEARAVIDTAPSEYETIRWRETLEPG